MSEKQKSKKQPFRKITGMWRRVSTNRVAKDGKPEHYFYGTNETGEEIILKPGARIYLYPHTNWKTGQANYFLKYQEPAEETEEEANAEESPNAV